MLAKKTFKVALSIILAVILAGMVVVSLFGFNKSADYNKSYEIVVGVDQCVGSASEIVKETADEFFAKNNVKPISISTQSLNNGARYIYKFNSPTNVVASQLKDAIQTAVNSDNTIESLVASVSISEVAVANNNSNLNIVFVMAIAIVVAFVYLAITEKYATSFVAIINSVISSILFIAIIGASRIPINATFDAFILSSFALSFILTLGLTERFKEILVLKGDSKPNLTEIVSLGLKLSIVRLIFVLLAILVVGIILTVVNFSYLFLALQILIAGISAVLSVAIFTCILWPLFKKVQKSK